MVDVPAVDIAATGVMDYQRPVVKNVMTEGRWMKATTFRVSDKQVVHHILTGVIDGDGGVNKTATETEWGASLGGYGPGRGSNLSPKDMGTWVPPSGGHRVPEPLHALRQAHDREDPDGPLLLPQG